MPLKGIENTISSKETKKVNNNSPNLIKTRHMKLRESIQIKEDQVDNEQENKVVVKQDDFDELFPVESEKKQIERSPVKRKAQDLIDIFSGEKQLSFKSSRSSSQTSSIQLPHTIGDDEYDHNPHLKGIDLTKNEVIGSKVHKTSSILITKKIKATRTTVNSKDVASTSIELADIDDSYNNNQLNVSTQTNFEPEIIETNVQTETKTVRKSTRKRKASQSPPPPKPAKKDESDHDDDILIEHEINSKPILFEEDDYLTTTIKRKNLRSDSKKSESKPKNDSDISEIDEVESGDVYEFRSGPNRRTRKSTTTTTATTKRKNPVVKLSGDKIKTETGVTSKNKKALLPPIPKRKTRSNKRDLIEQEDIEKMREKGQEISALKNYKLIVETVPRDEQEEVEDEEQKEE